MLNRRGTLLFPKYMDNQPEKYSIQEFWSLLSNFLTRMRESIAMTFELFTFLFGVNSNRVTVTEMPMYSISIDLRWRIVWAYLAHRLSFSDTFSVSERTVRKYVTLFCSTGDIRPLVRRHGPKTILGQFERMFLFRMILEHPGIYLHEMKEEIHRDFGVINYLQNTQINEMHTSGDAPCSWIMTSKRWSHKGIPLIL